MRTTAAGLALVLLVALIPAAFAEGEAPYAFTEETLPQGWTIVSGIAVDSGQRGRISRRLGGGVRGLTNQVVSVGGYQVRVNVLVGEDHEATTAIHATMIGIRGKDFIRRKGARLYEVAGNNVLAARRVFAALGLDEDDGATWKVAFEIALIDALDQTAGNRVFNHFLALEKNPRDEQAQAAIRAETKGWTFGSTLRLVSASAPTVAWSFDPEPADVSPGAVVTTYRFEEPPKRAGVPYVRVTGTLTVTPRYPAPPSSGTLGGPLGLTAATPLWPADDEGVRKAATAAVEGVQGARAKTRALLGYSNRAVKYGGAMGTRDGVLEVLERGLGRCWDKSDVLVTLCRAAKIPARQVGGWVPAIQAGHIWTEVFVDGGWLPVDATTTWLGTGVDYIPFFRTEEGTMPIVYLGMPKIERAD